MFRKSNLLSLNMATQYIVNDKGEKTAVIVPINEYEALLHHHQKELELTDEYKKMIDGMLATEDTAKHVSYDAIKEQFLRK